MNVGFENINVTQVREAIFTGIDEHDDPPDDPAPVGDVVDHAASKGYAPDDIGVTLARMYRTGEVYQPRDGHLRRTIQKTDD